MQIAQSASRVKTGRTNETSNPFKPVQNKRSASPGAFHLRSLDWLESFWDSMTYQELLQREEWRQRRVEYIWALKARPGWTGTEICESCFGVYCSEYHLHHRRYIKGRLPWEYDDDDLILLCSVCHGFVHDVAKMANDWIIAAEPHIASEMEMFLIALLDSKNPKSALSRAKNAVLECDNKFTR